MNKQIKDKIKEMYLKNKSYKEIGDALGLKKENVRGHIRNQAYYNPETKYRPSQTKEQKVEYKSREIKSDGSMVIEEAIAINDLNDFDKILQELDLDPSLWEVVNARFSEWDALGNDGEKLYATKVAVKPKPANEQFKLEQALAEISKLRPYENIPVKAKTDSVNNLVIPMYDLHFGNSTYESYEDSLNDIKSILATGYNKVVIVAGGDILNEDNYNGTTASGTVIGATDMQQAWIDCYRFFSEIITVAHKYSKEVIVLYVPGNHDTFSGHTVLLALNQAFKNFDIKFNVSQEVYKALMLDKVFVSFTHGHKASVKKYPMISATMFANMWGTAETRECFTGHLHTEWSSMDNEGLMVRQMPSRNRPDQWHIDMGFTASHKRFLLAEYDSSEIKKLHYC